MHVDRVPLHQIFLVGRVERRLRRAEVDADRRRMSMGNDDEVVHGRVGRDLQGLAQSAAPVDVGLKHVERILFYKTLETPARIFVLGARERNPGLRLQLDVAVDAVGHEALLDPARSVLLDAGAEIDGVIEVEALPAVDHDVVIVAQRLPQRRHQRDVLSHALVAAHRAVANEPLLRGVAARLAGERAFLHEVDVLDRIAEHRSIGGDAVAGGAAEDPPDRLSEYLALEVPERAIHGRNGDHHVALAAMNLQAVHLIPEQLGRERVLAHDDGSELGQDQMRSLGPDGPRGPDHAVVGMDFEEIRLEPQMTAVDLLAALESRLLAIFGIDVDRADEPVLPEGAVGLHHAVETPNPYLLDLQWLPPICATATFFGARQFTRETRSRGERHRSLHGRQRAAAGKPAHEIV